MMKHKEFVLADIAKLDNGNKMDKNKMTRKNPSVNFVSRTALNNGISDYVDKIKDIEPFPAGCITLAFGGSVGSCFLQEEPFYTGQNVGVITLPENITTEMKLYFITALEKKCKLYFHAFGNEINKHFKTDLTVSLPVIESEDEKHIYTPDDINWQYMQDRIAELEQDRIAELDVYLKATGLNDYELTEDDKHILASKLRNEDGKEPAKESEPLPEGGWWKEGREFYIADVFEIKNSKNILKSQVDFSKPEHPYLTAKEGNNSVAGYVSYDEDFLDKGNCVFIGGKTSTVTYQKDDFFSNDSHNLLLYPKEELSEETFLYLVSAVKNIMKQKYAWSNSVSYKKIQKDIFCLPIQTDDSGKPVIDAGKTYSPKGYIPDWEYMEKYIKATEKEIIKEVVLYKDKVIKKAKEIAGAA